MAARHAPLPTPLPFQGYRIWILTSAPGGVSLLPSGEKGARSADAVPGSPLIASHMLGTSPRGGEEGALNRRGYPYAIALLAVPPCPLERLTPQLYPPFQEEPS